MDITEFLTALLDEDEAAAKAALVKRLYEDHPADEGHWEVSGVTRREDYEFVHLVTTKPLVVQIAGEGFDGTGGIHGEHFAQHIARHDPARVLAEVAAKRALLLEHARIWIHHPWVDGPDGRAPKDVPQCRVCVPNPMDVSFGKTVWPCFTLKLLAAPYAEHPDFDPAWRVEFSTD